MTSNVSWLPGLEKKRPNEEIPDWKEWKKAKKVNWKKLKEEKILKRIQKVKVEDKDEVKETDGPQKTGRLYTVSIALPGSVLNNAQSIELRTYLAGQIARAASIFNVDEIIIFEDENKSVLDDDDKDEFSGVKKRGRACAVMGWILRYLECPQYLRKYFFPLHPDLKYAGLLNPLDCPHHIRVDEDVPYREGCTLSIPVKHNKGSFVDVGLKNKIQVDKHLQPNLRVTVRMLSSEQGKNPRGQLVTPDIPRTSDGFYWGYTVRPAENFHSVFSKCPYNEGYDLIIGTSDKGSCVDDITLPNFRHLLVVFGGLSGLEACFEDDDNFDKDDMNSLFNYYLNTCPDQGSRTIRTEEAILISLSILRPKILTAGQK